MTAPVIDAGAETETEDVNAAEDPRIEIVTATAVEEQVTGEEAEVEV